MNKTQFYTLSGALLASSALAGSSAMVRAMPTMPGVRNQGPVYAPDGGGGGGEIDASNPQVKALIDAAVESATKALKKNNDALLTEKKTVQTRFEELEAKVAAFGDIDPTALVNFAQQHKNEEYSALFKAGKFGEVINKEVEKVAKNLQKEIDRLKGEAETAGKTATEAKTALKTERIRNKVASQVKDINEGALDDVQRHALDIFDEDPETGAVVLKEGRTDRTKDGKPVTLETLNGYLLETRPYYFKASNGGGGQGGGKGGPGQGGPRQIKSSDKEAITKHRAEIAKGEVIVVD